MRASRPAAALLLAAGLGLLLGPLQPAAAASKNWTLLWGDDFEGSELDRTQWNYELGWGCQYLSAGWPMCGFGNKELQYYAFNNAQVHDGSLHIVARLERDNQTITSARVFTNFAVMPDDRYRTIRVSGRVKLDRGDGLWPAFWMIPKLDSHCLGCGKYGRWPSSGEIDLFETHSHEPSHNLTAHFGKRWPDNDWLRTRLMEDPVNPFSEWHTYAVEWELEELRWYYDGKAVGAVQSLDGYIPPAWEEAQGWYSMGTDPGPHSPFDQPFYILLNMAVGGEYTGFMDKEAVMPTVQTPKEMAVDWVRVEGLEWEPGEDEPPLLCSTTIVKKYLTLDGPCGSRAD